ncbi:MAG: hypothetical protein U0230_03565 [Polyangiales bacterium]
MRRLLPALGLVLATNAALADDAGAPPVAGPVDAGAVIPADAGVGAGGEEEIAPPLPPDRRPTVETTVEPTGPITIGQLVTLRIRATVREGDDVTVPTLHLAPFEVLRKSVRTERSADGRTAFVFTLEVQAFETGTHRLGPIRLRIVTADGTLGSHEIEARSVVVRSLLGNEPNAQPKPPTNAVAVTEPDPRPMYALYALLAALVGALLALAIRRYLARRPKVLPPPPPPRPPWEVAVEKLDTLRRERHERIEKGEVEAWADGVSDTMRWYLGERFGFDGLECTTDEILANLVRARTVGLTLPEVQALLHDCDLVKFAKQSFTPEQADTILGIAYKLVRATTPIVSAQVAPQTEGPR